MNFMRNLIPFLLFLFIWSDVILAQTPASSMDLRILENLRKELVLTAAQDSSLQDLVQTAAKYIEALENDKLKAQREIEDEELLLTQLKVIGQQIKDVREIRDLEIQAQLNEEQLKIYEEKIKPKKPQVLHFGLHNRADCKVCKQ